MSLGNVASAQAALTALDNALDTVNSHRSKYGAVQNRLESALNNIETFTANISNSASKIRDADFAHETAQLAKYQIMQQAGVSVLGQANALNAGALRLIG
jgi:flagellin